ncbi:MAG: aminotransferase class III-fold pyridoxal phosphate-dependent enzyme [Anaerolineales bacterium]|nr:aminotransferase class III-fold pyridoxal phosphate-dependent enzyme [Anaerolineales bacterium]
MSHILECYEIAKTDFERAVNCHVYDSRGKRYVDLEAGCWAAVLGHNPARIQRVIQEQAAKVIHIGKRYPNAVVEAAAVDVLEAAGLQDGKCVFLSSGSEAVEFAVRAARRASEKPLCLTFANSYLAAYGFAGAKSGDDWQILDWGANPSADPEEILKDVPFEKIGAFVFEPGGSGIGFLHFPPKPLVEAIARRVHSGGGLIAANEITTGMGRTGKWFGFQHYDIQPDIVALGKGLGNGYPVSAVAIRSAAAEALERGGFHYVQSHQNDPLGCAIAREVIAALREENWIERGAELGAWFLDGLREIQEKRALAQEARGRGMLLGLELQPRAEMPVARIYRALLERGYLVGYYAAGNLLRFDPSLTIDRKDILGFLETMDKVAEAAG